MKTVIVKVNLKCSDGRIYQQGHKFCVPADDIPDSIQLEMDDPNSTLVEVVETADEEEADEATETGSETDDQVGGEEGQDSETDEDVSETSGVETETGEEGSDESEPVPPVEVVTGDGTGEELPPADDTEKESEPAKPVLKRTKKK